MSNIDTNACACCQGLEAQTPVAINNPPGLTAIAYRVGSYAHFKASMLARLSSSDLPGLHQFKTHTGEDFSLAFLDSWAMVADVLTFYQERIANEAYKRTATEHGSILELARLVNYRLQPGIAAHTYLAFLLETAPGSPGRTTITIGTKVQSLPNPGEKPQTYETIEEVETRATWNTWKPASTQPQDLSPDVSQVILRGTNTNLRPGDPLLLITQKNTDSITTLRRIQNVHIDSPKQQTSVQLDPFQATSSTKTTPLPGNPIEPGVYALRVRASLFGYNAPDWQAIPDTGRAHYPNPAGDDWTLDTTLYKPTSITLDHVYTQITPGSWAAIQQPGGNTVITQITTVTETAAANYALSTKTSQLTLNTPIVPPTTFAELRQITIYAQSEPLALADVSNNDPIQGNKIVIPGLTDLPPAGRTVMVTGQTIGQASSLQTEIAMLGNCSVDSNGTTLLFASPLANTYARETLSIYGNIVNATQGETIRNEILGSGDASLSYQRFTLRQSPLTYVQAPTPDGKTSTLSITVDTMRWDEVDTLYSHGPRERIFVTHIEDDQSVTVEFGDGITGARLPTGEDNVIATYRKGIGLQGVVQPGQLSILQNRPLGVKAVTNPQTPTGADDPETLDDARRNASNTIFTLGRIVSKEDYEQFALSYARVAKAQATLIWTNTVRGIYVTIAGPRIPGIPDQDATWIKPGSALYTKIYTGMHRASDPTVTFALQHYHAISFRLAARVKVDPTYPSDQVLSAVKRAVLSSFSFEARNFGQPVTLNEVAAIMQNVPGVVTVRIDSFYDISQPVASREERIDATFPHIQPDGSIALADLLTIASDKPFDSLEILL